VFFNADDGTNRGLPFAVYDSRTGKRIFEDSAFADLDFSRTPDGHMSLRYLRVVAGDCSLPRDKSACWDKFRKRLGLESASMPSCTEYDKEGANAWDSVIAYPVEVVLFPQSSIKPLLGPVKCWPVS
jgi:hypothetical protein